MNSDVDAEPDELTPEEKEALVAQVKKALNSDPIAIDDIYGILDFDRRSHINVLWESTVDVKNTFLNGDTEEVTIDFTDPTYLGKQ